MRNSPDAQAIQDALTAFSASALAKLDTTDLAALGKRAADLVGAVQRAMVDKALAAEEAATCALCVDAKKSVAFVQCGHAVCDTCAKRVDCCPFCRGPALPTMKFHL